MLWMAIFVAFAGLTCKGVYEIFVTYFTYPVNTGVYVNHMNKVEEKIKCLFDFHGFFI